MSVNKRIDPGAMSNHAMCSKSCYLIWWGVSAFVIIEPHFPEEANSTMTVTSTRYRAALGTLEMDADCIDNKLRFQQNGAITHTARESIVQEPCFPDPSFHILVTSLGQPGLLTSLHLTTFFGNT